MKSKKIAPGSIGIFDSGLGGLTVFREIEALLPQYDYIYLGDNARTPYGTRDFDTIYAYTWQCVQALFERGCHLVILACNTASARALRNIQQLRLPEGPAHRRVLGVIRPTTEIIGSKSKTNQIGILATEGTVASNSYPIEIIKFHPDVEVHQQACPLWVPLVEAGEHDSAGADYFIQKNIDELLSKGKDIDTLLLACTHYPLLIDKIIAATPGNINIISQGALVAASLQDYLLRHEWMELQCAKNKSRTFLTTGDAEQFANRGLQFLGEAIATERITLK